MIRRSLALALVLAPGFAAAQEVPPSVTAAIAHAEAAIAKIVAVPASERTFENTLGALDDMSARLDDETSLMTFLNNVSPDAKVRASSRAAEEVIGNFGIALGKREDLYNAIKAYAATKPALQGEEKRMLEFTMRDYRRAGMDVTSEKRARLKEIEEKLNKLGIEFGQNIADDESSVSFTKAELKGVDADTLNRMTQSVGLFMAKMDGPTADEMLERCENPLSRQKFWLAFKRRGGQKNVDVLEQMIALRAEQARILGYKSFADYVLEPRMAKNAATVDRFYTELRPIVRKKSLADWNELLALKRKDTHDPKADFKPWDYSFYKSRLMRDKYAVDGRKVQEYFPMERVVDGLFKITQSLYGLEYKDVTAQADRIGKTIWHPSVKLFEVDDAKTHKLIGHFYLDMYPRAGKYTHAACWGLISHKVFMDGTVRTPTAAMVCNFNPSTISKPSLLDHGAVETFFHEFGHVLHNLLSTVRLANFSGTAVARDFVEAPSQMMENWVWEPSVLKLFARHYKTGAPLPDSLLKSMRAARNVGSGIDTEHQFFYGMMDLAYHRVASGKVDTTAISQDLYPKVELYKPVPGNLVQASFGHLVGYESGYYGYAWSLVYASDMFSRFAQLGLLSPATGAYYRSKILAKGGTEDEMAMLRDYLGREPNLAAFLKHLGMGK